jgi:3-hydroxyacyl-[acyl-carrier-protein] dehydratase
MCTLIHLSFLNGLSPNSRLTAIISGAVFFFAGVDGVKWKKPVVPGDTLVMEVEIKKWNKRFGIATAVGRAYVDGEVAVELDEM